MRGRSALRDFVIYYGSLSFGGYRDNILGRRFKPITLDYSILFKFKGRFRRRYSISIFN